MWFLAPTVSLCSQQYDYIRSQISAVQIKFLSGNDGVDHWGRPWSFPAPLVRPLVPHLPYDCKTYWYKCSRRKVVNGRRSWFLSIGLIRSRIVDSQQLFFLITYPHDVSSPCIPDYARCNHAHLTTPYTNKPLFITMISTGWWFVLQLQLAVALISFWNLSSSARVICCLSQQTIPTCVH